MPNYFCSFRLSDGSLVNVQILDTCGNEKYKLLNEIHYKSADCCLLVYDITDRHSFEECKKYYKEKIKEKCIKNIKVLLLANKNDLEDQRQVIYEEGANLALENGYIFM